MTAPSPLTPEQLAARRAELDAMHYRFNSAVLGFADVPPELSDAQERRAEWSPVEALGGVLGIAILGVSAWLMWTYPVFWFAVSLAAVLWVVWGEKRNG